MHYDAMIFTHCNVIIHCEITMDVPSNIIHCDVINNGHCDAILNDLHWTD